MIQSMETAASVGGPGPPLRATKAMNVRMKTAPVAGRISIARMRRAIVAVMLYIVKCPRPRANLLFRFRYTQTLLVPTTRRAAIVYGAQPDQEARHVQASASHS